MTVSASSMVCSLLFLLQWPPELSQLLTRSSNIVCCPWEEQGFHEIMWRLWSSSKSNSTYDDNCAWSAQIHQEKKSLLILPNTEQKGLCTSGRSFLYSHGDAWLLRRREQPPSGRHKFLYRSPSGSSCNWLTDPWFTFFRCYWGIDFPGMLFPFYLSFHPTTPSLSLNWVGVRFV